MIHSFNPVPQPRAVVTTDETAFASITQSTARSGVAPAPLLFVVDKKQSPHASP